MSIDPPGADIPRQVLHQLEQELNIKILPGTEIMMDVGEHHFVKSSASSDRVLVPQPSDSKHDPLVSTLLAMSDRFMCSGRPLVATELIHHFLSELDQVLEILGHNMFDHGFFCPGVWPLGSGSHLPAVDREVQHRSGGCYSIYGCCHSRPRFQ